MDPRSRIRVGSIGCTGLAWPSRHGQALAYLHICMHAWETTTLTTIVISGVLSLESTPVAWHIYGILLNYLSTTQLAHGPWVSAGIDLASFNLVRTTW